jgi:hypothetical protein
VYHEATGNTYVDRISFHFEWRDTKITAPGLYCKQTLSSRFNFEALLPQVHFSNPGDETNAFSVHFKTVPQDSTGIAHILEHVTLCGSEK